MYLLQEDAIQKVLQEKYGGVESAEFLADKARIVAGEPWQYVLGHSEFLGCRIDLSFRPMIPRLESAFWVEKVIAEWKHKKGVKALDLYAGSGNIGVALLKHLPGSLVTFSELDGNLLPGVEQSIITSGVDSSRATLLAGDSLEKVEGTFDIICANPPYIHPKFEEELDPEMKHEPRVAFFGSSDGLGHHRELIREGKKYLKAGGAIYCECDPEQVPELQGLLAETDWKYEFWDDPYGAPGVMVLRCI